MKKRICTIIFTLLFILTVGVVASACETDNGIHTIRFDTNCGNDFVATCKVKHGETLESPYDYGPLNTMRVGYYFAGWYKPNGERWSELEPINESMTLTAKWLPKYYRITYELNGGESEGDNPKYFTIEDEVVFNPAIRKGYKFEGWTSLQFSNVGYLKKLEKGTNANVVVTANWSGDGNDYVISSDGSHAIYNGYTGTADTITVLAQYGGKTVTEISDQAFANLNVKQVSIPSTITKLGVETFKGCTYLEKVILPTSITEIPDGAFENCTSLKSITIPSTVKVIGSNAFKGCSTLEEIVLPQGVMAIGDGAFEKCANVKSMTFPSSVTIIGANVLKDCSSISNLTINCSITQIPEGFVQNCTNLAGFNIPSTITKIGANAFSGCEQFTTINVPNTVESIGDSAFEGCKLLEQVTLPQSVTTLPARIFYGCTALKNFVLHDAITEIGDYAFYGLTNVENLNVPASVVKIGKYAFAKCTSLTEISVPKTVIEMGGAVFSDCTAVTSITLPFFGSSASDTKGTLQKVFTTLPSNLKSVTVLGGVVSTGAFKKATMVESITIADGVTVSGLENFYDCRALQTLTLPSNVQKIGRSAFYNCVSLNQITIPSSVTSIDVEAFRNCTSLTSIVIGKNVTYVGADAFMGCTLTIKCELDAIPTSWDGNWNRGKLEVELGYKE